MVTPSGGAVVVVVVVPPERVEVDVDGLGLRRVSRTEMGSLLLLLLKLFSFILVDGSGEGWKVVLASNGILLIFYLHKTYHHLSSMC